MSNIKKIEEFKPKFHAYGVGWGRPPINIVQNTPILPDGKSAIDVLSFGLAHLELVNGSVIIDTAPSGRFDEAGTEAYKTWMEYRQKFPDTKMLLGIGGDNNKKFFYEGLTGRIDETARAIAKKVEELGWDGVELDPEFHAEGERAKEIGNKNFRELVFALRKILPKEKIIGWDVFGYSDHYRTRRDLPEYELLKNRDFLNVFDHFQIMAYHDTVPFEKRLEEWGNIIGDKKKLILGHRFGEHSRDFMKHRSDYVRKHGYGGAFPWALSPEADKDREPGVSFFNYLQAIYAGLQGWALAHEQVLSHVNTALMERTKKQIVAFKLLKKPSRSFISEKQQQNILKGYKEAIDENVSLVDTILKLQARESVSEERGNQFLSALDKDFSQQLNLLLIYLPAKVKELREEKIKDSVILKHEGIRDIILKMKEGKPTSDQEVKKISNLWKELKGELSKMLEENRKLFSQESQQNRPIGNQKK